MQLLSARSRVALAMFAVGILSFILVDVLSSGLDIVNTALQGVKHHHESFLYLAWLVVLLAAGFGAGSAGLASVQRRMRPLGARRPPIAGGADVALAGIDANLVADEMEAKRRTALRTGLTIAAAIGVHNFAEGLAIGVSARAGAISLATVQRRMRPLGARRPPIAGGAGVAAVAGVDASVVANEIEAKRRSALRTGL
ncbi:MAG TPA: hypothetical protein VGG87_03515, partial [Solirubrobacteraceae bacterium]